jgi:hypothetical protein
MLMKKALLIALTLGLVCVWAVPAMAIDWIAFGGFTVKNMYYKNIDYRNPTFLGGVPGGPARVVSGDSRINTTFPTFVTSYVTSPAAWADPARNEEAWWLQMRGDIYIVARASADLQGVFGIEVNSTRFGEQDSQFISYTGSAGVGSGLAGRWNADAIAIQVKSMYIDFKVPMVPLRLKVGIQPFRLREPVFLYADAAGVTGNIKIPVGDYIFNINPFWAVQNHGIFANQSNSFVLGTTITNVQPTDWTTADDGNFFGVDFNAVIGDIKPGMFFAMQRLGQVYTKNWDLTTWPGIGILDPAEGNQNMWWLGAYVDGKVGPIDFTGDFIYNGGYDQWKNGLIYVADAGGLTPGGTVLGGALPFNAYSKRHEAWITRSVVAYNLNKFRFGMGFLYATGDNVSTTDKQEGFMGPYRTESAKFNDDFVVLTGDWGLREPYGTQNVGGLFKAWSYTGQGVWYIRGFADYAVTDWLKLKVNAGYIEDTVKGSYTSALTGVTVGGDEFGGDANNDQQIGWELDAGVQINIYKNLYLDSAFGYLIGGKALLSQAGGERAQDPWAWATVLSYVF